MKKNLGKKISKISGTSSKGGSENFPKESKHGSKLTFPKKENKLQVITEDEGDGDMKKEEVRILGMKTARIISKTEGKRTTRTIMVYFAIEGKWKEIPLEKLF